MAATLSDLENTDEAVDLVRDYNEDHRDQRVSAEQARDTRDAVEGTGDFEFGDADAQRFRRSDDRWVRKSSITHDGDVIRTYAPPAGVATAMLEAVDAVNQREDATVPEVVDYLAGTLDDWTVDDDLDADHWRSRETIAGMQAVAQKLAFGGTNRGN